MIDADLAEVDFYIFYSLKIVYTREYDMNNHRYLIKFLFTN